MLAFVVAAVSILAAGFALWPVIGGIESAGARGESDTVLGRLRRHKQVLMDNLSILRLEFDMGKLDHADYERQREELETQAARIFQQIELLEKAHVDEAASGDAHFCSQCGVNLPAKARFCPGCGEKVAA